jgi:pimeloyl-ACP methyl ester carboxylesterase
MKQSGPKHHECVVSHPDGRRVLASVIGARDFRQVLFYSHGFPASRLEATIAHERARDMGLTIVALDRPGFGGSDWYSGRRLEDWARDVALVADSLGVRRFGILGVSGGTPTAIAAAGELGDRVTVLSVVSGVSPLQHPGALGGMNFANKLLLQIGWQSPRLGKGAIKVIASLWRANPVLAQLWFRLLLPESDLRIGRRPVISRVISRAIREGLRQGTRGVVTDFELLISDWRHLLGQVGVPSYVWHGDADTYVPIGMGEILAKNIPGSIFRKVEGGGHFMIVDTLEPILATMAAHR